MDDKTSTFLGHLKHVFVSLAVVVLLSLLVAAVGVGGGWVISHVSIWWAAAAFFALGLLIFATWNVLTKKLGKTEKLKSEFVTIAAHRLRTPLTRVQWTISEVATESGMGENNPLIVSLKEIFEDLTKAINHLLEASEAGKPSLYYSYVFEEEPQFGNIVRQIVADYVVGVTQKNITLNTEIEEGLPVVVVDREQMKIALGALVENAILYTPRGGTIVISILRQKKKMVFSITDSGIGISKEALPSLFTKFFRAKEAVSLDRDRAGLGLFIAKQIIEKHGGHIYVESKGKDQGSHFWFDIPAQRA